MVRKVGKRAGTLLRKDTTSTATAWQYTAGERKRRRRKKTHSDHNKHVLMYGKSKQSVCDERKFEGSSRKYRKMWRERKKKRRTFTLMIARDIDDVHVYKLKHT